MILHWDVIHTVYGYGDIGVLGILPRVGGGQAWGLQGSQDGLLKSTKAVALSDQDSHDLYTLKVS